MAPESSPPTTTLHRTRELGQSVWYDNISRGLLRSGELARLCAQGVLGVTSNPTIFDKAISGSTDYDETLRALVAQSRTVADIYEALVVDDIRQGCDLLRPAYDASGGVDGRVSVEVLPDLASDTERTTAEGLRLHRAVARDNVMIKVPATPEGLPAIRALTAKGVSVNVTLIFSVAQYQAVAAAYLAGLEDRVAAGGAIDRLASVASFFVSRVDTACDALLSAKIKTAAPTDAARAEALLGKIAIANAKIAYEVYGRLVASPRWKALAARGGNPQRLLWASTGTKDPRYSDTMYVDALIGPDTVDTMPPATLAAFLDHGRPTSSLAAGLPEAKRQLADFAAAGFDLEDVCRRLLADGVKSFAASMTALLDVISARREAMLEQAPTRQRLSLSAGDKALVEEEMKRLAAHQAPRRLWNQDPKLFSDDPAHEASIRNRLGWLAAPRAMQGRLADLRDFAAGARRDGLRHTVLLGMGGSGMAPEVLSALYGTAPSGLPLLVLDNTDPAAVAAVEKQIDLDHTLFVVASKSGGTIEIKSFERTFWEKVLRRHGGDAGRAGQHFAAITDPDTVLAKLAADKKYRRTFLNPPDIGGRYSALSYFGLVPAALLGVDLDALVGAGVRMAAACGPAIPAADNPGMLLGAVMAALGRTAPAAADGRRAPARDKITFICSPDVAALGAWIEQLVAESTGKDGKGLVPIDLEPAGPPEVYAADRLFVYLRSGGDGGADGSAALDRQVDALRRAEHPVVELAMPARHDVGGAFFRWEVATAVAGAALGVNPFDEPNVTEAKNATGALLAEQEKHGRLPAPDADWVCGPGDGDVIRRHLASAGPGDYLAFCAYFLRTPERDRALTRMRVACRDRARNATTLGYGPRFLHSTGQLHKGGANNGVFIQLTADAREDLPIPGESFSFGTLRDAQALGDLQVLRRRGRRALRVHLGSDIDGGLETLAALLGRAGR